MILNALSTCSYIFSSWIPVGLEETDAIGRQIESISFRMRIFTFFELSCGRTPLDSKSLQRSNWAKRNATYDEVVLNMVRSGMDCLTSHVSEQTILTAEHMYIRTSISHLSHDSYLWNLRRRRRLNFLLHLLLLVLSLRRREQRRHNLLRAVRSHLN